MPNEGAVIGRIIGGIFVDNDQNVGYQGCGNCSCVGFCSNILFKGTEEVICVGGVWKFNCC